MNQAATDFWQQYLATLPAGTPAPACSGAEAFGDSPEMADELGELMLSGAKTATCSALWEYEAEGEPLPVQGTCSIVLDGRGQPLCIVCVESVEVRRFRDVDADFARAEGEGDRTLESWRAGHRAFFERSLAAIGREPTDDMPLVCERFRVVHRRA